MPPKRAKQSIPPPLPSASDADSGALSSDEQPWKSRFPVARIKKIMQADDDVGKVSQVVPVIISKALELFMQSVVHESAQQAVETGHRKVVLGHVKLAVKANEAFDFLLDKVQAIPDVVRVEKSSNHSGNRDRNGDSSAAAGNQPMPRPRGRPVGSGKRTSVATGTPNVPITPAVSTQTVSPSLRQQGYPARGNGSETAEVPPTLIATGNTPPRRIPPTHQQSWKEEMDVDEKPAAPAPAPAPATASRPAVFVAPKQAASTARREVYDDYDDDDEEADEGPAADVDDEDEDARAKRVKME
ncbi:transcription initiation factor TFIID subunit 11 [Savitreella phatthalungensis]